ncbi:hypothetical protein [Pseudomonas nabeulensis]|uniref:hypothetical protein n=1 Tax=Pseudomonas nabeulensis TaxID=2293833 RepID=UPI0010762494|nr:hypothetical protein [Pseudomonas nabeulensis]
MFLGKNVQAGIAQAVRWPVRLVSVGTDRSRLLCAWNGGEFSGGLGLGECNKYDIPARAPRGCARVGKVRFADEKKPVVVVVVSLERGYSDTFSRLNSLLPIHLEL